MSEQNYLSEAIRAARRRAGLSQAALAAALGVRQSSISQWERGSTRPSTDHLLALTAVLRTTLLDFTPAGATPAGADGRQAAGAGQAGVGAGQAGVGAGEPEVGFAACGAVARAAEGGGRVR